MKLARAAAAAALALMLVSTPGADSLAAPRGGDVLGTVQRVRMVDGNRFRPATLRITRGTKVRWVNRDNVIHTTTSNDGRWDRTLDPGERFARRFRRAGTFDYRCTIHLGMNGTIIVTR